MARRVWTTGIRRAGIAAAIAIAIAGTGLAMAVTADRAATPLASGTQAQNPAKDLWVVAEGLLAEPVRLSTLSETTSVGGHWFDHYTVPVVVAGEAGTMTIARSFGASDETDISALLAGFRPTLHEVTVGFRPDGGEQSWFWARYTPDGALLNTTDGRVASSAFHATADGQCIAQAWIGQTPTS